MSNQITITGEIKPEYNSILTKEALDFVCELHKQFNSDRLLILHKRKERQERLDNGDKPNFLESTKSIREKDWKVEPVPADIQDRRVEITGPVERKMIINALNSGAKVFMADFEDSNTPTWDNVIQGQINLCDANRKTISYVNHDNRKTYKLNDKTAVLFVRPRGWHLDEKHVQVNGQIMSGSLFDFGLYLFHNAKQLKANGTGPYFYLPKLESHIEARLWNEVFVFAQNYLGIPQKTIKATVLIETILAVFELDEILYELKDHSAGLNCGRWDYIFSFIKKFNRHKDMILPERSQVTMNVPFMKAYYELVIKTCHKRDIHAMGGMAAQIPIKGDEDANRNALQRVSADKEREAKAGHDGTWVAHPGLIPTALEQFDKYMPTPNQIHVKREDVHTNAEDLIRVSEGTITKEGFRNNIDVSLQYMEAWLNGLGCVPIYNLMEDAATAEISRSQLWQWVYWKGTTMSDGTEITKEFFESELVSIIAQLEKSATKGKYDKAARLLREIVVSSVFPDFLTSRAYKEIN